MADEVLDVNVSDVASSTTSQGDVTPAADTSPVASPDVKPANSSPAEGVKAKEAPTLKDRIADGIAKITGKTTAPATPAEAKTEDQIKAEAATKDTNDPESDAEKTANDEWRNNPATKAILNERKQARAKLTVALKEMETYKGDAAQYRKIQTYLDTNGVMPADAASALKLTALARTNPQQFYEKLMEMADQWGQHLGATLPADLQKDVDEGLISQERATELARTRGQVRVAETQVQHASERAATSDGAAEMAYRTRLFDNWSSQVAKTDPDLQKKLPMMADRLSQILASEGNPGSPEAAWERLNRAHKEVTERIRAFQPARPATAPSPASTGTVRGPASPPSNFQEAMAQGIQKLVSGNR